MMLKFNFNGTITNGFVFRLERHRTSLSNICQKKLKKVNCNNEYHLATSIIVKKPKKIIDAVIYLMENFTEEEIKNLKRMNIINNTVVLAMNVKKCFDKQKAIDLITKYEHTAEDMGLSERYVRRLLNE